ncbi:MAG: DUF4493 domain-containing protein [Bacteroidota bacterium]
MKNIYLIAVCLLTVSLISCQKEEPQVIKETGSLHIDVNLFLRVNEVNNILKSTAQTENFKVTIYKVDGTPAMVFENAADMPAVIELETGNYYVEAHSDNNLPAAFENPYYYGGSEVFAISSNTQQSVLVSCELANTIVSVVYSANLMNNFSSYATTVSSQEGSLVFSETELRMGYFKTSPLDILVELSYLKPDGTPMSKTLSGSIPDPLANRHYQVLVDASIDEGMASFQIVLDETEVLVEVVEITDGEIIVPEGPIGYGDLLISELMYNPAALSDTEGEWFEIYNSSSQVINLQNLVIERDDINRHVITESIELAPGAYYVLARTLQATDASNTYVYGSAITLSNTGALLSLYNEDTDSGPGALIFSLNYGEAGFPDGTGASISLSPEMLNATDAILGSSWCVSSSLYNTGDSGTPGTVNDLCNQSESLISM